MKVVTASGGAALIGFAAAVNVGCDRCAGRMRDARKTHRAQDRNAWGRNAVYGKVAVAAKSCWEEGCSRRATRLGRERDRPDGEAGQNVAECDRRRSGAVEEDEHVAQWGGSGRTAGEKAAGCGAAEEAADRLEAGEDGRGRGRVVRWRRGGGGDRGTEEGGRRGDGVEEGRADGGVRVGKLATSA